MPSKKNKKKLSKQKKADLRLYSARIPRKRIVSSANYVPPNVIVTRSYAKMMHPWEGKLKQFKIALETCPKADAIAWLTRGGPISLPDLKINTHSNSAENAEAKSSKQTKDLTKNEIGEASGIDISVQQESPEQPEDLPMNDNDEAGGVVALVQQESTPNSHAFPPIGHRRQSFAGGVLFSVENRVVEMGGDFLHRMMAGTMIFNRFDPFKRMPNGPLRVRSRSIDSFEPMSSIQEVDDDNSQ